MNTIEMEITFHRLSWNKYRCNETGVVVSKAMRSLYANAVLVEAKKAAAALVVKVPKPEASEDQHEPAQKCHSKHR